MDFGLCRLWRRSKSVAQSVPDSHPFQRVGDEVRSGPFKLGSLHGFGSRTVFNRMHGQRPDHGGWRGVFRPGLLLSRPFLVPPPPSATMTLPRNHIERCAIAFSQPWEGGTRGIATMRRFDGIRRKERRLRGFGVFQYRDHAGHVSAPLAPVQAFTARLVSLLILVMGVGFFQSPVRADAVAAARPFPQHTRYAAGSIKPGHVTQARLDGATLAFYQNWKAKYLAPSRTAGDFFVLVDEEEKGKGPKKISVSEGHGYGMLIAAFMAGADPQAHEIFDGMWRFARAHPSHINPRLMAWKQVTGERSLRDDDDSATDGDLDIAQALLLADAQWGSAGTIHYRDEARAVIAAIKKDEINAKTWTVKLGDWVHAGSPMHFSMRISDFVPGHFRCYQRAADDADWSRVLEAGYQMLDGLQSRFSAKTGLLPDFVVGVEREPRPPTGKHLEGKHDGHYSYNACRVPFRLGLDFLLHGEPRAQTAVGRMSDWVKVATGGRPERIVAGYDLDGKIIDRDDLSMAFTACFGVGAMCDAAHQDWLNALWDHITASDEPGDRYYARTLKMLCLIAMSGNWWSPAP